MLKVICATVLAAVMVASVMHANARAGDPKGAVDYAANAIAGMMRQVNLDPSRVNASPMAGGGEDHAKDRGVVVIYTFN